VTDTKATKSMYYQANKKSVRLTKEQKVQKRRAEREKYWEDRK
jgi:hypothetical protein